MTQKPMDKTLVEDACISRLSFESNSATSQHRHMLKLPASIRRPYCAQSTSLAAYQEFCRDYCHKHARPTRRTSNTVGHQDTEYALRRCTAAPKCTLARFCEIQSVKCPHPCRLAISSLHTVVPTGEPLITEPFQVNRYGVDSVQQEGISVSNIEPQQTVPSPQDVNHVESEAKPPCHA